MRIAVVNLTGGVGKTTTAVHLAVGLARRAPTVLADSDPQGSASRWDQLAETLPCRTVSYPKSDLTIRLPELMGGATHLVIETPGEPHSRDLRDLLPPQTIGHRCS